jgi:hypothetical protein
MAFDDFSSNLEITYTVFLIHVPAELVPLAVGRRTCPSTHSSTYRGSDHSERTDEDHVDRHRHTSL